MAQDDKPARPELEVDRDDDQPSPAGVKAIAATAVLFLLFGFVLFGAIRGCGPADPQELAKLDAEKKKEEERKRLELEKLEDPKIGAPPSCPTN